MWKAQTEFQTSVPFTSINNDLQESAVTESDERVGAFSRIRGARSSSNGWVSDGDNSEEADEIKSEENFNLKEDIKDNKTKEMELESSLH